jgi:Short C-terminal domain
MVSNAQAGDEVHFPHAPADVWLALRSAVGSHPNVKPGTFNDTIMRAEFKTGMTIATYGQSLSASVRPDGLGSRVTVSGVAKWATVGGRDQARVRRVAGELLADVSRRLQHVALPSAPAQSHIERGGVADELSKLAELRDRGVLTQDEFDQQKSNLLHT